MEIEGEKLRGARNRKALTLKELAEQSGVNSSTIWQLESGRRDARPSTIRKLVAVLGIEPSDLMADDGVLAGGVKETRG